MAAEKLAQVAGQRPDALVLAADTVVAVGRRILPKTETAAAAGACLDLLSGRGHRVLGAIALGCRGRGARPLGADGGRVQTVRRRGARRLSGHRGMARQSRRLRHPGPRRLLLSPASTVPIPMLSAWTCTRSTNCSRVPARRRRRPPGDAVMTADHAIIEQGPGETRAAVFDDTRVVEIWIEPDAAPDPRGAVVLGKLRAHRPELAGAFVDIGDPAGDAFWPRTGGTPLPPAGSAVVVQVRRAAAAGKGPRVGGQNHLGPCRRQQRRCRRGGHHPGHWRAGAAPRPARRCEVPLTPAGAGWWVDRAGGDLELGALSAIAAALADQWRQVRDTPPRALARPLLVPARRTYRRAWRCVCRQTAFAMTSIYACSPTAAPRRSWRRRWSRELILPAAAVSPSRRPPR